MRRRERVSAEGRNEREEEDDEKEEEGNQGCFLIKSSVEGRPPEEVRSGTVGAPARSTDTTQSIHQPDSGSLNEADAAARSPQREVSGAGE